MYLHSFYSLEVQNGIPPNDNSSNVLSTGLFSFFQNNIKKGIVSSQCADESTIPIETKFELLVLEKLTSVCVSEQMNQLFLHRECD